jgi:holin-like protein
MMAFMRGMAILLGFQLCGVGLHAAGIPMPGTVLGLILFTASLFTGLIKLEWVENTSSILLGNMLLFFAPIIVYSGSALAPLKGEWVAITASILVSLLAVMLTTGLVTHHLLEPKSCEGEDE